MALPKHHNTGLYKNNADGKLTSKLTFTLLERVSIHVNLLDVKRVNDYRSKQTAGMGWLIDVNNPAWLRYQTVCGNFSNFIGAHFTVYTTQNRKIKNLNANVEKSGKFKVKVEMTLRANHGIFLAAQNLPIETQSPQKANLQLWKNVWTCEHERKKHSNVSVLKTSLMVGGQPKPKRVAKNRFCILTVLQKKNLALTSK